MKLKLAFGIIALYVVSLSVGINYGYGQTKPKPVSIKKKPDQIKTVSIGNQIWMAENLNVSTYRNGDTIPEVQDAFEWSNLKTGAWCYYENKTENGVIYGKLYNFFAVNDKRGLAPEGWHIASDSEWTELAHYLGSDTIVGEKLKSNTGWDNKGNGKNTSGFTALAGGYRLTNGSYDSVGSFDYLGKFGYWWTGKTKGATDAWPRILSYNNKCIVRTINNKRNGGMSVRCVKNL